MGEGKGKYLPSQKDKIWLSLSLSLFSLTLFWLVFWVCLINHVGKKTFLYCYRQYQHTTVTENILMSRMQKKKRNICLHGDLRWPTFWRGKNFATIDLSLPQMQKKKKRRRTRTRKRMRGKKKSWKVVPSWLFHRRDIYIFLSECRHGARRRKPDLKFKIWRQITYAAARSKA